MATRTMRKIVKIDQAKCNGCGLCVPSCAEGAIQIIDGKAHLVAENLCDGLGNCLGQCPVDAITVEERPAEEFDERAVAGHLAQIGDAKPQAAPVHAAAAASREGISGGCPGSMLRLLDPKPAPPGEGCPGSRLRQLKAGKGAQASAPPADGSKVQRPSQLGHWPVQLALVPTSGPIWQDADVLICADCVPFALPEFHERLLAGKTLAIACPKLDDVEPYVKKLATIFANNTIRSITVAHMEVPCCLGIVHAVREALDRCGRNDIEVHDVTVGIEGTIRRHG